MESPQRISLIIAEDQDLVRRGIAISLALAGDIACVGEARNGDEAVRLAAALNPDIVLMDLHMPIKGGVAATREIRLRDPNIQVLVLTTLSDDDTVFEALLAGAHGYLLKDVGDQELLDSIRALHRHEAALTPPLAQRILDKFQDEARKPQSRAPGSKDAAAPEFDPPHRKSLTSHEARLLTLLADGKSEVHASEALGCSESASKSTLSRIMEKLHVNSDLDHAFRGPGEPSSRGATSRAEQRDDKR
ncbi:MAG TPA: response regulator transcription factor [Steroidobacteraceae bacterium]|jgi:DNA-binding NarL/FixJ family response regulator